MFGSRFKDINFKGDIFGGVTTAIISLPLALAFWGCFGGGCRSWPLGRHNGGLVCLLIWWLKYTYLRTHGADDGDHDSRIDQYDGEVP